jgi:hypothetical protein
VLGDEFGLCDDEIGVCVDEDLSYGFMIVPPPSAEERLVRCILDERMAENQRVSHHAADDDELGGHELMQRSIERPVVETGQSVDAVVEFQQDDISEAITSGNSAVRTIPGLDPAIHPPAKEMDPRVEPGVTDVMHS